MSRISDPHFAERVRASFDRQNAMALIQASLPVVEYGCVEISLPHWPGIEQQHGFVHGGVVGMIADSAAGYAAMTMVPASTSVLTVEYKMNLLAPADGQRLIARGQVVRAGKTLIVTQAGVFAVKDGRETQCALMQQTIMTVARSEKSASADGERSPSNLRASQIDGSPDQGDNMHGKTEKPTETQP